MNRLLITKRLKITKGVKSSRNPYEEKMRGGGMKTCAPERLLVIIE
jgi:hypothetical protein